MVLSYTSEGQIHKRSENNSGFTKSTEGLQHWRHSGSLKSVKRKRTRRKRPVVLNLWTHAENSPTHNSISTGQSVTGTWQSVPHRGEGTVCVWMVFKHELRSSEQFSRGDSVNINCPLFGVSNQSVTYVVPTELHSNRVGCRSNKVIWSWALEESILCSIYCKVSAPSSIRYVANGFPMAHSSTINTTVIA